MSDEKPPMIVLTTDNPDAINALVRKLIDIINRDGEAADLTTGDTLLAGLHTARCVIETLADVYTHAAQDPDMALAARVGSLLTLASMLGLSDQIRYTGDEIQVTRPGQPPEAPGPRPPAPPAPGGHPPSGPRPPRPPRRHRRH